MSELTASEMSEPDDNRSEDTKLFELRIKTEPNHDSTNKPGDDYKPSDLWQVCITKLSCEVWKGQITFKSTG